MAQICWLSSMMRISSILTRVVDSPHSGIFGLHYTAAARRRQLVIRRMPKTLAKNLRMTLIDAKERPGIRVDEHHSRIDSCIVERQKRPSRCAIRALADISRQPPRLILSSSAAHIGLKHMWHYNRNRNEHVRIENCFVRMFQA